MCWCVSDPPEVPRLTSVEVRGRTAEVKWNPVDVCVPHFQHYNYRLVKVFILPVDLTSSVTVRAFYLQLSTAILFGRHLEKVDVRLNQALWTIY